MAPWHGDLHSVDEAGTQFEWQALLGEHVVYDGSAELQVLVGEETGPHCQLSFGWAAAAAAALRGGFIGQDEVFGEESREEFTGEAL